MVMTSGPTIGILPKNLERNGLAPLNAGAITPEALPNIFAANPPTFAIPLLLYRIELGSDIHDIHVDVFHKSSHAGLWQFWRNQAADQDWDALFEFNAYYGTLPPGYEGK